MEHGTRTAYYDGCRCEICRAAEARYQRERRRGIRRSVRTQEARIHIGYLLSQGMTKNAIAAAADLSPSTINRILTGQWKRLGVEANSRLLGVAATDTPKGCLVHRSRVAPVISAIRDAGLTKRAIGNVMGHQARTQIGDYEYVSWKNWDRTQTLLGLLARQGLVDASLLEEVAR